MSSKTITKTSIGIQKPNNTQWSPGVAPRLSKAKSSPNVSKAFATTSKQSTKPEEKTTPTSRRLTTGNRSGSSKLGTPPRNAPTSKPRSNITIVQIQGECPTPATRVSLIKSKIPDKSPKNMTTAKIPSPRTPKGDLKKKSKDSPLILEDRALLKKGLQTTPEKLPKKPEELRKKTLNRSTSLWNVDDKIKSSGRKTFDGSERDKGHKILDRTSSLWNVSADAGRISRTKSIAGLRPSRIPLSTQLFGLGQSLADLTQVDRNAERFVQKIQDLDEVDRSMDEHIYANCRETIVSSTCSEDTHIYENLKNQTSEQKKKLSRAKSAPLQCQGSLDLERRAQELMSQLDEDDDPDMSASDVNDDFKISDFKNSDFKNKDTFKAEHVFLTEDLKGNSVFLREDLKITNSQVVNLKITNSQVVNLKITDVSESVPKIEVSKLKDDFSEEVSKHKDSMLIPNTTKEVYKQVLPKEAPKRDVPNLKEAVKPRENPKLRSVSQVRDVKIKDISKISVSKSREDLRKSDVLHKVKMFAKSQESLLRKDSEMSIQEIRRNWEMQIKKSQKEEPENEIRRSNVKKSPLNEKTIGKKTKDIENLVEFFNKKNTEATKEVQDSWSKIKESGSQLMKDKKEKDEKSSGYISDGNCSEDSGHMSNENENEEAQQELKNIGKSKRFLEEIIQDLDHSLEHTIEVFEATPIVQRFIPAEEEKVRTLKSSLSTSSGASSIDSWEETLKVQRGNVEKGNWKTAATFSKTNGAVSSSVVVTHRPQIAPKPAPLNTSPQVEISTF